MTLILAAGTPADRARRRSSQKYPDKPLPTTRRRKIQRRRSTPAWAYMNHSTPFKPLYSSELVRVENDGEEIFEEYFDDEIKNGDVGGEFDYDMDYDDQGEEVDYENGEDVGAEMGGFDYENENDFVNETVDVYSHGGVEEQGEGKEEGVEDIGEGLTFEIEDIDAIPQRPEPMEDADVAPSDEDLVEGETIVNEEEEGLTEYEIIGNEKNGDPDENEKISGHHTRSPFQECREQLEEGGGQLDSQDICEDPRSRPVEVRQTQKENNFRDG